jgi:hypothetical protein
LTVLKDPPTAIQNAALAGFLAFVSSFASRLTVIDPVDLNYTTIAVPILPRLDWAISPPIPDLVTKERQVIALLDATTTSVNRASGASQAGDTYWVHQQENAIANYKNQLAPLLPELSKGFATYGEELSSTGRLDLSGITPTQVTIIKQFSLLGEGLPSEVVKGLQEAGLNPTAINSFTDGLLAQDDKRLADLFHNKFNDPGFNATATKLSQDLVSPIPEPSPLFLWVGGLLLFGLIRIGFRRNWVAVVIPPIDQRLMFNS